MPWPAQTGPRKLSLGYARILKLIPDSVEARNNLGSLLAQQGKLAKAISHFSTVLGLKPEYGIAHDNLGNALVTQGKLAESITHYTEALRLMPAYVDAYYTREDGRGNIRVWQYHYEKEYTLGCDALSPRHLVCRRSWRRCWH